MSLTRKGLSTIGALIVALSIFALDLLSARHGAVAVLYVAVILLVAPLGRKYVMTAGISTTALTVIAFAVGHLPDPAKDASTRFAVSLIAIGVTTLLSLRDRSLRTTLSEQARVLELSHDTVIIRDTSDVILHWNDGAERLYGWSRWEALGRSCNTLLECSFPRTEVESALAAEGHWAGEVTRTRRDGTRLVLASRWLLRRDPEGRAVGVIESSSDLTEHRRADAGRQASEQRFRTMFDASGFATWEADWSETIRSAIASTPAGAPVEEWLVAHPEMVRAAIGKAVIRNANQAAVDLFQAGSKEALVGANLCGRYLPEGMPALAHIIATIAGGANSAESEIRLRTLGGRDADVVFRVTLLQEGERCSHVLVMAFDVTERNEARARLEQTSAELAHAARVSILGQLAASIAHEVNQPLAAIINYGKSGTRWLTRPEPDLAEVAGCLEKIVASGSRAADVIGRVRGLARKAAPHSESLHLCELIDDAVALVQHEARATNVSIRRVFDDDLPLAVGDRVQVQQVLVNLLMNGVQAMSEVTGRRRELSITVKADPDDQVSVAVQDRGSGFPDGDTARIFEPFFSTKEEGMGMGLSICRSIIESQGGRISASNNAGPGVTVAFTLPVQHRDAAAKPELIP